MKTVCAYCKATMAPGDEGKVSHGICPACAVEVERELTILETRAVLEVAKERNRTYPTQFSMCAQTYLERLLTNLQGEKK